MRCDDVKQELTVPTGALDPADLAAHQAHCPACAAAAARAAKLDRLWEATRPVAPSAEVWDAVWARTSAALDRSPAADVFTMPEPAPSLSPRASWIFVLAQSAVAAAVLLALFIQPPAMRGVPRLAQNAPASAPRKPAADNGRHPVVVVEYEQGQFPVIRVDRDGKVEQADLAQEESLGHGGFALLASNDLDRPGQGGSDLVALNALEGAAAEGNASQ